MVRWKLVKDVSARGYLRCHYREYHLGPTKTSSYIMERWMSKLFRLSDEVSYDHTGKYTAVGRFEYGGA